MANTGRRRLRRELLAAVAIGALLFPWGSVTALQEASLNPDSYGWDPAGIIAGSSEMRNHTLGVDVWDVWVCDTSAGTVQLSPETLAATLTDEIVPYFEWLSGGRYQPEFRPAATVAEGTSCINSVRAASDTNPNGALIVRDVASNGGSAQAGVWCPYEGLCPPSALTFPDNYRSVTVDAYAVMGTRPRLVTVVHEMAHALHFPHVYSGATGGTWAEYDDPTDVMSQAGDRTKLMGTTPVNRYAAGWFDAEQIEFVGAHGTFTVAPIGEEGTQLVVVPHGEAGWFTAIGARVQQSYDAALPRDGVIVHLIDQRPSSCGGSITCFALSRRTQQWPATAGGYDHLVPVGGSVDLPGGYALTVAERVGSGFRIEVADIEGPAPPPTLSVSGMGADQIELHWGPATDNGQVAGYEVGVDGIVEGSTTGYSYSLSGLRPNSTYRITVRGIDTAGNAGSAAEVTVRTLPRSANLFFHNPRSGRWQLTLASGGMLDFFYGVPGDLPLMCDWNGDGIDTVGLYRARTGFMYLRDSNSFGIAENEFFFGMRDDVPVCGDWNGDGLDTVGIFRPTAGRFYLRNSNTTGFGDVEVEFGRAGDVPFAGDWDGDGIDSLGVYRPADQMVYLHGGGFASVGANEVVIGDLDGDDRDDVAFFDSGAQLLITGNGDGSAARLVPLGGPGWNVGAGWWG